MSATAGSATFARATKRVAIGDDDGNHWSTLCCRRYHQQAKRPRINGAFRFFEHSAAVSGQRWRRSGIMQTLSSYEQSV
jgi:hypothetical protein